ncbi:hypothetical protein PUR31_12375 [Pseudomonas mosselii]|uniref:hypothetical protein n=1 Tax=unclassified Pseudomonas TaxID=196821 RepID=UPI0020C3037A|nr:MULTISPECIES: hypothetical protein [unclassified Pseudomonas]MCP8631837.1 hypothetical protein [Pseudomonas sp. DVZ6]MDD7784883.1 hypothetical protein [Pseudomonas sp. DVZ24]
MHQNKYAVASNRWGSLAVVLVVVLGSFIVVGSSGNAQADPKAKVSVKPLQANAIQKAVPWSRTFGTFCIQDVPGNARKVTGTGAFNGVEVEFFDVNYKHDKEKELYPLLRVFKEIPESPNPLATCSELKGETVMEGRVRYLKINGGRETVPGEPKAIFMLPKGSLEVEVIKGKAQIALYGGTMQVGKGLATKSTSGWAFIKNPEDIVAQAGSAVTGSIDLESWGRDLVGAKVVLPGTDKTTTLDMSSGNSNVTVRLPLSGTGEATFRVGTFKAKNVPITAAAVVFPGAKFGGFKGVATDISLKADTSNVNMIISKLGYSSTTTRFQAPRSLVTTGDAKGNIESIVSAAGRSGNAITLQGPEVSNLVVDGKDCGYDLSGASLVGAMACKVSVLNGKGAERNWRFASTHPSSLFGAGTVKSAAAVEFSSVVKDGKEDFKGVLKETALQLGALGLQRQQMTLGNPTEVNAAAGTVVQIPFSIDAPPTSSSWSLLVPEGKVLVEGSVSKAKVKGVVNLDLADLSAYALEIGKDDLSFEGKVTVTHEPYLYGAKPSYGSLDLGFLSATALHIAKQDSIGTIEAKSNVLVLTDPLIALGGEEESLVLTGPQKFAAGVVLAFDLGTGHGEVKSGLLNVTDVRVTNQPGKAGDLGGVRMWEGEATVGKLLANFQDGKGALLIEDVGLKAKKLGAVPKADDSGAGNQLVWTGTLKTSLGIQSIEGKIVRDEETKGLKVMEPLITEAKFGIGDIQMGQGNSVRVVGGDLDVHLEKWGESVAKGFLSITNSHIASRTPNDHGQVDVGVGLQHLKIQITGGTSKAPRGKGQLLTTNIDLKTDTILRIPESCDDKPDFQGPPVRLTVTGGPSILNFDVIDGGLHGQGAVIGAVAVVDSTGGYTCARKNAIDFKVWPEKIAKYHYPCPTWSDPTRMCEGWTRILPEFRITFDRNIVVRQVKISGVFTVVALSLKGNDEVKACGKYGSVVPLMDVSYYVTPHTNWSDLNSILDSVIKEVSRPFASAFMTGLGAAATNWMANFEGEGLC